MMLGQFALLARSGHPKMRPGAALVPLALWTASLFFFSVCPRGVPIPPPGPGLLKVPLRRRVAGLSGKPICVVCTSSAPYSSLSVRLGVSAFPNPQPGLLLVCFVLEGAIFLLRSY